LFHFPLLLKAFAKLPREKYTTIFLIGLFGSGAPAFLFALSMTKTGSAVNGIINSLSPLWTLIIGYFLFKIEISAQKMFGVIIGFAGAVVLVLGKENADFSIDIVYGLLPVIATFCYGMSTNITKQKLQNQNPIYTTSIAMCMIGVPAIVLLSFTDAPAKIMSGTAYNALLSVVMLSVFGTLIAWMLFYRLVQRTDALFAASVTYLIPVVAITWGLLDGELLGVLQVGGMALILTGVYFTTLQKQKG
jgi:drug/metabolite transporter (DMT)-like permease